MDYVTFIVIAVVCAVLVYMIRDVMRMSWQWHTDANKEIDQLEERIDKLERGE